MKYKAKYRVGKLQYTRYIFRFGKFYEITNVIIQMGENFAITASTIIPDHRVSLLILKKCDTINEITTLQTYDRANLQV